MVSGTTRASRATAAMLVAPYPNVPEELQRGLEDPLTLHQRLLLAQRRMI